jgi:pyruvate/2-oxoglutarate dehydrogenase complex dihydrolipoamide dehydrogenase (E3) component
MGSAGIAAAELAAALGLDVAAVERERIGGDCLWTGCVPSKALLASARAAHQIRTAELLGLEAAEPEVDLARVWKRIRAVQEEIAATDDSRERFEALGVEIVEGDARLTGPHTVSVGGRELHARFLLLCTGSRTSVPPVAGLSETGFVASETLFRLERVPRSFVIIGGGPVAVELAQGFSRLGIRVVLLELLPRLLAREEPELVEMLTAVLRREGVEVHVGAAAERVSVEDGLKVVSGTKDGAPFRVEAEELLVAAGRTPRVDGLGLEEIGVEVGPGGVRVDGRLRTSVPSIYAAGDVAGRFLFTHSAAYEATIAVRNMFLPRSSRVPELVPWCTFTDPELAHAGLTVAEARERFGADRVRVRRIDLARSDRARADGTTEGAIILVTARERVVGAHVLAPAAGELIHELALLVHERRKLLDISGLVHVYPTYSTSINLLVAEAAYERARRFRWLARRRR